MKDQTSLSVKSKKKGGEYMKKILLLSALVVLFAAPAMAAIKDTKHNLGTTGDFAYKSSNETEICIFCHTPHNATKSVPLWNRSNPVASGFKLYTASPTLNISTAGKGALSDDSISLFCLSCHDGAAASLAGRVINEPNGNIVMDASGDQIKGKANLGTNLTNDHPINFRYSVVQAADGTIKALPADLRFFRSTKEGANTDYLECASCHDVHGTGGFAKFLRKSNASSSLCLTCHNK